MAALSRSEGVDLESASLANQHGLEISEDGHSYSKRNDSGSDSGEPTSPSTAALLDPELELELEAERDALDSHIPLVSSQGQGEHHRWGSKYLEGAEIVVPSLPSPTTAEDSHKSQFSKLHFDPKLSQTKRRKLTLEWQKRRRDHILDKIRQLEGDSGVSDNETDDGLDFLESAAPKRKLLDEMSNPETLPKKKRKQKKKRFHGAPTGVMLSEWLIKKPEDFEDKWIGVLCPAGKRVIVVASRGKTKVYSRREDYLGGIASLLPGGRKGSYNVSGNRGRGVTILDCIYSETAQVFYVLDLICWNSHSCVNCDTEYRQFFLASKISENQDLMVPSPFNHIPFMPLPYFLAENLPTIMTSTYPPFPDPVDGVLFSHKEAFYISEVNPLCLWVRLSDMNKRLAIDVNPELLAKEAPPRERKYRNQNMDCDSVADTTEASN